MVLIASQIHVSAIIWLPVCLVIKGKPFNYKVLLMMGVVLLATQFVSTFTNLLEDTLTGTIYDGLTDQFAKDDGSNIMHTLIAAVPVGISLLGRKTIDKENNSKINMMVNISVFGMAMSLLANFTSGLIIGRMPIYFTIFNYALIPWLIRHVFTKQSAQFMKLLCYLGYAAYMAYYFYAQNVYYVSSILRIDTRL